MDLTETRDLRGGRPIWLADRSNTVDADPLPEMEVDVAIVGAGIMGSMLADRLTADGKTVVLLDRRPPAHGSTAASTALVMWAADVPLTHLGRSVGAVEAGRRWQRVYETVRRLAKHIDDSGIDCGRVDRPELYLAGSLLDGDELRAEGDARRAAGLPSLYLDPAETAARFGIAPRAALLSEGGFEVDPVRLTLGFLARARKADAKACFPVDVIRIEDGEAWITLHTSDGRNLRARDVVLASGYERARWFLPSDFSVGSSYAIATPPGVAPLWHENAMIWEAASPYLYTRATSDGRIIAGGEDEDFSDAEQRDALIGEKAGTIAGKLASLIGAPDIVIDCAWSAAFGSSPDGLPAIGRAANHDRLWLAAGFGGNGVSFAALGTEIIAAALRGETDPDAACFDPYRFRNARGEPA